MTSQWQQTREPSESSEHRLQSRDILANPREQKMDIYGYASKYENQVRKIRESEISGCNEIVRFLRHKEVEGLSKAQLIKYMLSLRQFFSMIKKPAETVDSKSF